MRWYRRHYRDLPWRDTRDPYKIWVSEVMLQQTRVEVVRDYYARWLRVFSTAESLAHARYSRVLKLWEGLGYYSRATNLHRGATIVVREHSGELPRSVESLRTLPGIGRYTAGAIASIAFDQRAALVDGNVARVLARVFAIRANVKLPATEKRLWLLAEQLLPRRRCGEFNQALMELGALVCTPSNPRCEQCPLRRVCIAYECGEQDALPNRGPRRATHQVTRHAALVQRDGKVLLQRRPARGLLANMWELPPLDTARFRAKRQVLALRHTITNQRITLRVWECNPRRRIRTSGDFRWVSRREMARLTLAAAQRRALERLLQTSGNCSSPTGTTLLRSSGNRASSATGPRTGDAS